MSDGETLWTTAQAAEYLNVDEETVRRLVRTRKLSAYKVGTEYRFRKVAIEEYLERQHIKAQAEEE